MSIKLKGVKQRPLYEFTPQNKSELKQIIERRINQEGPNCSLNDIDVSNIDDMGVLFYRSRFNGDISKWDVSNVISMYDMFKNCPLEENPPEWYRC